MVFQRYHPAMSRTFALRAFNSHETEINRHYWSFKVMAEFSAYQARQAKKTDPKTKTAKLFSASGPDAARIPATVSNWLDARDDFENWLRISIAVSASSYFEGYIRQAIRSALMSDPLCRFNNSRLTDGLLIIKKGEEISYERDLEIITKGNWEQRISGFRQVFGHVPPILNANKSTLDNMRLLRNEYAHGFGRNLDVPSPSSIDPGTSRRLSPVKLLDYLAVISRVAAGIDKFLLEKYIGNFELLLFYHEFCRKPIAGAEKSLSSARRLQKAFNRDRGWSTSATFCSSLITYYDSVN